MSNDKENYSNEMIHAFVDDQLTIEDKAELYKSIHSDEDLSRQVCEIRKLRDLVQLGYADLPEPPRKNRPLPRKSLLNWRMPIGSGIAASIALVTGILIGGMGQQAGPNAVEPVQTASAGQQAPETQRVLFHLNSGKTEDMRATLNDVDQLLNHYASAGVNAQVEVITNGRGITLLDAVKSPFRARVEAMLKKNSNLTFVACQNSIDRHKSNGNITAKMIPGTVIIDSGVAQIMRRQSQGWAYIQA